MSPPTISSSVTVGATGVAVASKPVMPGVGPNVLEAVTAPAGAVVDDTPVGPDGYTVGDVVCAAIVAAPEIVPVDVSPTVETGDAVGSTPTLAAGTDVDDD